MRIPGPASSLALAFCLAAFAHCLPSSVLAETAEEKGRAIALEGDRRDQGWHDSKTTLRMVLRNAEGESSRREMRLTALEMPDPAVGDLSLTIFDSPRDVEGTALLSHTNILEPDDQWLYLPALKRVKRISSANKSGPFVGSEFAFEDLLSQEVDKWEYRYLKDEPCGDLTCFVVERRPLYENSGYTRQIVWSDQAEYQPRRIEFYDRKDSLLKTLELLEYRQYLDRYWRAHQLEMVNHQTQKSTTLEFDDYQFENGLGEGDFRPGKLKRLR